MIPVVYFNQWFSSIGQVIEDAKKRAKKDGLQIKFIASSKTKDHVYKKYVDKFIYEDYNMDPNESPYEYIDWVIKLCKREAVDIFIAKRYSDIICNNIGKFIVNNITVIHSYNKDVYNKVNMYKMISESKYSNLKEIIPEYKVFDNDIDSYLLDKLNNGMRMCIKTTDGEGGSSYREVVLKKNSIDDLFNVSTSLTVNEISEIIKPFKSENFKRFMCMQKLDSPEISVDCLRLKDQFISVAREKKEGRVQALYYNNYLNNICEDLYELFNLNNMCNIQFRHDRSNRLCLIDINPRMSGGSYMLCKAGINLLYIMIMNILIEQSKIDINDSEYYNKIKNKFIAIRVHDNCKVGNDNCELGKVSHIEKAVLLD